MVETYGGARWGTCGLGQQPDRREEHRAVSASCWMKERLGLQGRYQAQNCWEYPPCGDDQVNGAIGHSSAVRPPMAIMWPSGSST
jgi:hypothetical protein